MATRPIATDITAVLLSLAALGGMAMPQAASASVPSLEGCKVMVSKSEQAGKVASSGSRYIAIKGARGPGPEAYDRVFVEKFGPDSAKTVLILIPGTSGGAGSLAPAAFNLASEVKGLQVWAFDRREQCLEDHSGFASGDPDAAAAYYLGPDFKGVKSADAPYAAEWGLNTHMNDLKNVVLEAKRGGRQVVLGGHSSGAQMSIIYAAWDFPSGAGYKDLAGLVLIDGGLFPWGGLPQITKDVAIKELAAIRAGDVFKDNFGAGKPELSSIFFHLASQFALKRPHEPSAMQTLFPKPGPTYRVTNKAYLGYLFTKETSPFDSNLRINAGQLGPEKDGIRDWIDGQVTPVEDMAKAWSREPGDALEWYWPKRLTLDIRAAVPLVPTEGSEVLGLRMFHTKDVDLPLYAMQTTINDGIVLKSVQRLIDFSKIPRDATLVDASATMGHLDPITAPAATNTFTKTAAPFLRRIVEKRR